MKTLSTLSAVKLLCAVALTTLVSSYGASQNLISNPDFDTNDTAWHHDTSLGQAWSSSDADLCAGSGSLTASSVETSPGFQYFSTSPTDCVAVTPGETLHVSLEYWSSSQWVRAFLRHCADSDCYSCASFSPQIAFNSTSPGWTTLSGPSTIPGSGVAGVLLFVDASLSSTSPFSVGIDRVYLGRADRINADGFEAGTICRWSSSAGLLMP